MLPKIEKILYATGLGPAAPYVFRYALSLAQQYDATIIAVHGMEPLPTFAQSLVELHISHEQAEELHRQARQKAKERLQERIERLCGSETCLDLRGQNRVSAIHIVEGQPSQVVLQVAAESGADLIVMGSHRHTVIGEALLGTTTHKVLHGTDRPVLVVRIPEGYREQGF
ncbi:MAG: universal stress protein [Desulfuromonadales bacterium]|nr:universal stress protein [Desulfuromonadales bacterium]